MGKSLVLTLYCEGKVDQQFLPIIIQRTAQDILARHAASSVDVLPIETVNTSKQSHGYDILAAARSSYGYHALIVHKDSDKRTYQETIAQCFEPGHMLVQTTKEPVCDHIIPLIPVREVEAWMLADPSALLKVCNTRRTLKDFQLPKSPAKVELDTDPKATLHMVFTQIQQERGRKLSGSEIYEPLAIEINLEKLGLVPAYKQFVEELKKTFIALKLLRIINS